MRAVVPSIFSGPLHLAPALSLTNALPSPSTATQRVLEAQETALSACPLSIGTGADHEAGLAVVGVALNSAPPSSSIATQRALDAHETPVSAAPSILTVLQLSEGAAPAGAAARHAAATAHISAALKARMLAERRSKRTPSLNTGIGPRLRGRLAG